MEQHPTILAGLPRIRFGRTLPAPGTCMAKIVGESHLAKLRGILGLSRQKADRVKEVAEEERPSSLATYEQELSPSDFGELRRSLDALTQHRVDQLLDARPTPTLPTPPPMGVLR